MAKKKKGPSPKKHRLKMAVLSEEEAAATGMTRIEASAELAASGKPFMTNTNFRVSLECGDCGRVLLEVNSISQVQGGIWQCPDCGTLNQTLMLP